MSKTKKSLLTLLSVLLVFALSFGVAAGLRDGALAETETRELMKNGAIESESAIDSAYGNLNLWYSNAGGVDATFDTAVKRPDSTGSLKHAGAKQLLYRVSFDRKEYGQPFVLSGWAKTETGTKDLTLSVQFMQGDSPYGSLDKTLKTVSVGTDWTEYRVEGKIDFTQNKIIIGAEGGDDDIDISDVGADYSILNLSFGAADGKTVWYDDWSFAVTIVTSDDPGTQPELPADGRELLMNGTVESDGAIDAVNYGTTDKWYSNLGALDATFDTAVKREGGSTGSLKHTGAKPMFYRTTSDKGKYANLPFVLLGYAKAETGTKAVEISFQFMQEGAPFGSKEYRIVRKSVGTDWTPVWAAGVIDLEHKKISLGGDGSSDIDLSSLASDFALFNIGFGDADNKTVWYDDWHFMLDAPKTDYSVRDYDGEYDNVAGFGNIGGNLLGDADVASSSISGMPSIGAWGGYGTIVSSTEEKLTGTTSAKFTAVEGWHRFSQGLSYNGNDAPFKSGKTLRTRLYVKGEASDTSATFAQIKLVIVAKKGDAIDYPIATLDEVEVTKENFRYLESTFSYDYDAEAKTLKVYSNGKEVLSSDGVTSIDQMELGVYTTAGKTIYIDSATCFGAYEGSIQYLNADGASIEGLTLNIADFTGKELEDAVTFDSASKTYRLTEQFAPVRVSATVNGETIVKELNSAMSTIVVCPKYTPKVTLKDIDGKPISKATVKLLSGSRELVLVEEGTTGVYSYEAGIDDTLSYSVKAVKGTYIFAAASVSNVAPEQTVVGTIPAPVTYTVTVSLFDKDAKPITGATIELQENGETIFTLEEKGNGVYELDGIDGYEFTLKITLEGYEFEDATVSATNRNATVTGTKTSGSGCSGCDGGSAATAVLCLAALAVGRKFF